ncbi:hypothetical protein EYC98_17080 [Halieaceae bacterium IMCC14734]|uniref:Uncharacterized protein n=1 Tax=Candidatus Litorirhabdus singularis TaxID=2518993 RepID=A0ABT3TKP4_9GAMM|nr:hypothetical protein [Candidatus Litorirhabdus singularis]MCX2982579.1 hypothetical protein [Candidatus Litorirhabdus singularis]
MSLYRFARLSALLAFAGKYRMKLFLIGAAAAFALVTSWLYTDVASFLQQHYPQWIGLALVFKTLIVYAALFFLLWQLRPSSAEPSSAATKSVANKNAGAVYPAEASGPTRLDQLAEKPKLKSRKESILNK